MGFLDVVTPAEMQARQTLSLATMAVMIFVGHIPPLRPYAARIRLAAASVYIAGLLGFIVYVAAFR